MWYDEHFARPRTRHRAGGEQVLWPGGAVDVHCENTARPAMRRGDINDDVPHIERG